MATVNTWYGAISSQLFERLQQIRLVVCDVDGVFSDGCIYLGNDGEELKAFHTRDGFGVKALLNAGIDVAVITGRESRIVQDRMQALGVKHIYQGQADKEACFEQLVAQLGLTYDHVASIGDDVPDLAMLTRSAVGVCVNDGHPYVQQQADYITSARGGYGAVRELSDLILTAQGQLQLQGGISL